MIRVFVISLSCVGFLTAKESCELKNQWGENACSLQGSLTVESNPERLQVTKDKCNPFLPKSVFKEEPTIKYPDAKSEEMYTLVMVDPDAPKHPKGKYFVHWIVNNIPGGDIKMGNLKNGKVVLPYFGPAPPQNSGTHRYMILVYRQEAAIPVADGDSPKRPQFDLATWLASKPGKLCGPVSGVQFRTNFSGKQ